MYNIKRLPINLPSILGLALLAALYSCGGEGPKDESSSADSTESNYEDVSGVGPWQDKYLNANGRIAETELPTTIPDADLDNDKPWETKTDLDMADAEFFPDYEETVEGVRFGDWLEFQRFDLYEALTGYVLYQSGKTEGAMPYDRYRLVLLNQEDGVVHADTIIAHQQFKDHFWEKHGATIYNTGKLTLNVYYSDTTGLVKHEESHFHITKDGTLQTSGHDPQEIHDHE
jgi:hypothetical protein